jgi:hypothetical protein
MTAVSPFVLCGGVGTSSGPCRAKPFPSNFTKSLDQRRCSSKPAAGLAAILSAVFPCSQIRSTVSSSPTSSRGLARKPRRSCELLSENQSTYIPLGARHRLANPGKIPAFLIEVQSGSYLDEDDIVRFEDVYGRNG